MGAGRRCDGAVFPAVECKRRAFAEAETHHPPDEQPMIPKFDFAVRFAFEAGERVWQQRTPAKARLKS